MSYAMYQPHLAPLGLATPAAVEKQNAALAVLQAHGCYSRELDACVQAKTPTDFPGCAAIQAAYAADEGAMNAAVDKMPYCPESGGTPVVGYIAAAAFGLAAGLVVGSLL